MFPHPTANFVEFPPLKTVVVIMLGVGRVNSLVCMAIPGSVSTKASAPRTRTVRVGSAGGLVPHVEERFGAFMADPPLQ